MPVWGIFHHIYRFGFLGNFALAFLFGLALNHWLDLVHGRVDEPSLVSWPRRVWYGIAVVGTASLLWWRFGSFTVYRRLYDLVAGLPVDYPFLRCVWSPPMFFAFCGMLIAETWRRRWASHTMCIVLLTCFMGADLLIYGLPAKPVVRPEDVLARAPVTTAMPPGSRIVNVSAWNRFSKMAHEPRNVRRLVGSNTGVCDGLEEAGGYLTTPQSAEIYGFCDEIRARVPFRWNRWVQSEETPRTLALAWLRLASIEYVVADEPIGRPGLATFSHDEPVWAYRVEGSLPRAVAVGDVISVGTVHEAFDCIRSGIAVDMFDPASTAVAIGLPRQLVATLSPGSASVLVRDGPRVDIEVDARDGPTFLVQTDAWRPEWHAFVDGREVPLWRTNVIFRGVLVPQGKHRVTLRHVDPILDLGMRTTAGTLIVAGMAWLVLAWRRRAGCGAG